MHELSIAENILEIVEQSAEGRGALKVNRITLDIGRLSGVETDALRFAMETMVKGTVAEEAEIIYHELETRARCADCGFEGQVDDLFSLCPGCRSTQLEISQGREMKVASIEIELKN